METLDRLYERRNTIDSQIAALESLPAEPRVDGDTPALGYFGDGAGAPIEANVIFWNKVYGNGRNYTYAAVRAGDGLWYTTGPNAPKGYDWTQLISWITDSNTSDVDVWWACGWERL